MPHVFRQVPEELIVFSDNTVPGNGRDDREHVLLDGYRCGDVRMRIVTVKREVFDTEIKDVFDFWIQPHGRQWPDVSGQLQLGLIEMIAVDMVITDRMDEVPRTIVVPLRQHMRKQGITRYVEAHADNYVRNALVEMAGETLPLILVSRHSGGKIELEHGMTWW